MNIYRVDWQYEAGYDEFDMFVVQSTTAHQAVEIAKARATRQPEDWRATKIGVSVDTNPKDAGIICESFNAG